MAKKAQWFVHAEEMYVFQMMTLVGISREIPVSTRTLQDWKDEGDWDRKRAETIRTRLISRQETEELYTMLVRSVKTQVERGMDVDPAQGRLIQNLHKALLDMKKYEDLTTDHPDTDTDETGDAKAKKGKGLTPETLAKIEEELGLL